MRSITLPIAPPITMPSPIESNNVCALRSQISNTIVIPMARVLSRIGVQGESLANRPKLTPRFQTSTKLKKLKILVLMQLHYLTILFLLKSLQTQVELYKCRWLQREKGCQQCQVTQQLGLLLAQNLLIYLAMLQQSGQR